MSSEDLEYAMQKYGVAFGKEGTEDTQPESDTTEDKSILKWAGEGISDLASGVNLAGGQLGRGLGQVANAVSQFVSGTDLVDRDRMAKLQAADQADYNRAVQRSPIMSRIGKHGYDMGAMATVPGGMGGGLAKRALTGAASGAAISGSQYLPENQNTGLNRGVMSMIGGLGGGIGAPALFMGAKALNATIAPLARRNAQKAVQKLAAGESPSPRLIDRNQALANRQGIRVTPGELTGSPTLLAAEKRLTTTPKGQNIVQKELTQRNDQLRKNLNKLVDDTVPEGTAVAQTRSNQLFEAARAKEVGKEAFDSITDSLKSISNPSQRNSLKNMLVDAGGEYKPNSIGHLDKVYRKLGGEISALQQAGDRASARELIQVKDSIGKKLKELSPEWEAANKISQRLQIQRKYTEIIDTVPTPQGKAGVPRTINLEGFYDKTLKNNKLQREFIDDMTRAGGKDVGKAAKHFARTMNMIRRSSLGHLATKETGNRQLARGVQEAVVEQIDDVFGAIPAEQAIKALFDPKNAAMLKSIRNSKMKPLEAAKAYLSLLPQGGIRSGTAQAGQAVLGGIE